MRLVAGHQAVSMDSIRYATFVCINSFLSAPGSREGIGPPLSVTGAEPPPADLDGGSLRSREAGQLSRRAVAGESWARHVLASCYGTAVAFTTDLPLHQAVVCGSKRADPASRYWECHTTPRLGHEPDRRGPAGLQQAPRRRLSCLDAQHPTSHHPRHRSHRRDHARGERGRSPPWNAAGRSLSSRP
jgi:hypothetical protein